MNEERCQSTSLIGTRWVRMFDQESALRDLVELRRPVADGIAGLEGFGWDSDQELVTLTVADAVRLLEHYGQGMLTSQDCSRWAGELEGRDDLAFQTGNEDLLKEFLFDLSTPEIQGPISPEVAQQWMDRFQESREGQ